MYDGLFRLCDALFSLYDALFFLYDALFLMYDALFLMYDGLFFGKYALFMVFLALFGAFDEMGDFGGGEKGVYIKEWFLGKGSCKLQIKCGVATSNSEKGGIYIRRGGLWGNCEKVKRSF